MSRYQVLRQVGCDVVSAAFIAGMNWLADVPSGTIRFLSLEIEYDSKEQS